jgi:hypothetical protein
MAYDTYVNIKTAVLEKIGISDSDVETVVKQALNDVLEEVCQAHNFSWLYGNSSFVTVKPYETGTVTVTEGSATIAGSSTVWTSAMVGRKFYCGNATYEIATFISTTSLTLTTVYAGDSGSGLAYKIYADEYSLASDVEDILSLRQENYPQKLAKKGIEEMDQCWPQRNSFGYPSIYSIIGYDTTGYIKIAVYPVPNQARNIYYRFKKRVIEMSDDDDTCIIPLRYRRVLFLGAVQSAAEYLDMPDIAKEYERKYEKGLARLISADRKIDERIVKGSGEDTDTGNFLGSNYPLSPL